MNAAIYCRVSTEDQEREGTSLDSQLEACTKKANELGYETSNYTIQEAWSGLTLDRPKLTELREWIRNKEVDAVIAYSTDRLSRDPLHLLLLAEEFDKAGISLVFVTEPLDNSMEGQLLGFVRGWASKLEVIKIRERSIRGKRSRAIAGKLPSGTGHKLYGYDYMAGKGVGEGIRYINEAEAKWVREMYRWLVEEGLSINGITRRLRTLGVPSPTGAGFWIRQTVYRILTNPAYIGKTYAFTHTYGEPHRRRKPDTRRKNTGVQWRPREEWIEIPNATPPIISQELFEAAQNQLKRNKQLSARNAKHQYLLSGYVFCSRCGRRYQGYVKKWKGNGKVYEQRAYRCGGSQTIVDPNPCNNKGRHAQHLEDDVWTQIEALLSNPEQVLNEIEKKEKAEQSSLLESRLQRIEAQLVSREKEKDRIWYAFRITGDEDKFKKDIAVIQDGIKALQEERTKVQGQIVARKEFEKNIDNIKAACELVSKNMETLSFEEKRLVLKDLSVKVWVDGQFVTIDGDIPIVSMSPRLPKQHWLISPL